jgi:hypothetical protein
MVSKAGILRDGRNRFLPTSKFAARPRDPTPSQILPHRVAELPPKQLRQMHGMYAGDACHICEPVDLHRVRVEIGETSIESLMRLQDIAVRVSTRGVA